MKLTAYVTSSYLVSMIYVFFVAESMVTCSCTNCLLFITLAGHLDAQIRILTEGVRTIDDIANRDEKPEVKNEIISRRIKNCVQHQLIIIK